MGIASRPAAASRAIAGSNGDVLPPSLGAGGRPAINAVPAPGTGASTPSNETAGPGFGGSGGAGVSGTDGMKELPDTAGSAGLGLGAGV
jgi:hypothetical protein